MKHDSSATVDPVEDGKSTAGEIRTTIEPGEGMLRIQVWQDLKRGKYVLRGVSDEKDIYLLPEDAQRLYRELKNYFGSYDKMIPHHQVEWKDE